MSEHNIYFLAVARVQGEGIVVAQHSNDSDVELSGVTQVIEQPNMNMQPGKHYSFTVGTTQGWHLISDELGLIYILICAPDYKPNCAYMCLEELQRQFMSQVGQKACTAESEQYSSLCRNLMQVLCKKYNDLATVDKLAAVAKKVENVKVVMQDNVDIALQNCVKLENIEKQAEELQQQAGVFKKNANELKNKMRCKEIKLKLCIALIVLSVLAAIIGIIVWQVDANKPKNSPSQAPTSRRLLTNTAHVVAEPVEDLMAFVAKTATSAMTQRRHLRS